MTENSFSLSFDNLKSIPFDKYDKNFTFIVDGKKYLTNRFYADILSPIICGFHYQDETITEFSINSNDENQNTTLEATQKKDYFKDFLKLCNFEEAKLDHESKRYFCKYFLQLGNFDMFFKLQPEYLEDLTPENVIHNLKNTLSLFQDQLNIINYSIIKKFIGFIAEHFNEIDQEKMATLNIDIIEKIIQNESFQIDEEDTLLQFIIKLYNNDSKCSFLFENVFFNNVSDEVLEEFIETINFDDINKRTFISICYKLFPSKCPKIKTERYIKKIENLKENLKENVMTFSDNGIMSYLTKKTGGNIHDNNTIEITTNSFQRGFHPKNLVDYQSDNYYASNNEPYPYVCFDFKDKRIKLSRYSIKTYKDGNAHLKNWVLEVSNDKSNWKAVDSHSNDSTLNQTGLLSKFNCEKSDEFYRFIQLRTTGKSWHNSYYQYWQNMDFFGEMK